MSKFIQAVSIIVALTALVSGCGGGGSAGGPVAVTPVPAPTFSLQSGYKARIASGSTTSFIISGTCAGSAQIVNGKPAGGGNFEGVAALAETSTSTVLMTNCIPASTTATSVEYFDSNYTPLGHNAVGDEYGVFLSAPTALPTAAKSGDTGSYGTETIYTDSSKKTLKGQRTLSYVIEPDGTSTSTVIANLITRDFNTANLLLYTEQSRFRMRTDGTLTPLSIDVQYSTTSSTHLVFTAS